ncbi:hypothetical protein G7Y89_g2864 [Cudoniella acicularis]|uniref:Oxidase ustYa n=1 Tax=Cudoniella acicularis TaxID=354080 RepID=A0A8H4RSH0_9HELO|nr:hypothetical protein G7Y89_g2864 [Cudoniella acicularis]
MFFAMRKYQKISHDEDEKLPLTRRSRKLCASQLPSLVRSFLIFLLGLCSGLTVTLPFVIKSLPHRTRESLPVVIPPQVFLPKIPTAWVPDERYMGYSNFSNIMWHRLIQPTQGVWLPNPAELGLGEGYTVQFNHSRKDEQTPQFYHISNLHQLHCLNIIRGRYFELYYDTPSLSKVSETAAGDTAYHVDHCIEYLRMTIMCGAGWFVESNSPPGTPHELKINPFGHPIGWGGVRNCVNWDALVAWQKQQLDAYMHSWKELK